MANFVSSKLNGNSSTCRLCGAGILFQPASFGGREFRINPTVCSECIEQIDSQPTRQLGQEWEVLCPKKFRVLQPDKVPNHGLFELIMTWEYDSRGVGISGPSGVGKTLGMWQLLKRLNDAGYSIMALSGKEFQLAGQKTALDGSKQSWLKRLSKVDALFLDDLGKERFTETMESDLFYVLDARYQSELPMFLTTNLTRNELEQRFSESCREAFMRRLKATLAWFENDSE